MHYAERPLPIRGRGNVVIIALVATMLSDVVATVFEVIHYGIIADLDRGKDLPFDRVNNSDIRRDAGYGLQAVCLTVAASAFIAWFHRGYSNLPRLKVWKLRFDVSWTIGAWFVPVLNLWRPKQIANDLWRGSEPVPGPKRLEDHPRVGYVVHLWWAMWLLGLALLALSSGWGFTAQTLPAQKTAIIVSIVANGVYLLSAAAAIPYVLRMTKRQTAAIEQVIAEGPPPPIDYRWGGAPMPVAPGQLAPGWGQPTVWGAPGPWSAPGAGAPQQQPGGAGPPAWIPPSPRQPQGESDWLPPEPPGSG
jgi:hypothetical protein